MGSSRFLDGYINQPEEVGGEVRARKQSGSHPIESLSSSQFFPLRLLLWDFFFLLMYSEWTCFGIFVTLLIVLYTASFLHIDLP